MQVQKLSHILQYPEQLDLNRIDDLKAVVEQYPYFQPARALYLKALKNKESFRYNTALKVTAAHTTDRSILFDFITSEVFNQNAISEQIKQNSEYIKSIEVNDIEDVSINRSIEIDDKLKAQIQATEGVLDPNLFKQKEESTPETALILETPIEEPNPILKDIVKDLEETLEIGKPLEFSATETHSFSEWLKITSFKPIERAIEPKEPEPPLMDKMDTIDKFIQENPKIKPAEHAPKPKLIDNNSIEDSLMTETLARIYVEQKNYEKALQSYRILSLKYPEKSIFFAHRIKSIEELRDRNNIEND